MAKAAPATLTLVRHKAQPVAASIARLAITATLAYLIAGFVPIGPRSVLAPLTALLVAQVTAYQTIRSAFQRVVSVVVGVLVAVGFSAVVGFTWWSLAVLIAAGLALGYALRLGAHVVEVPISAMVILSLDTSTAAVTRIVETLIGAAVGMIGGLIFAPARVQPAEEAIDDLSRELARLLEQIASGLTAAPEPGPAEARLSRARSIAGEVQRVEGALAEAEESLRLNPKARSLPHTTVALCDGLETLEHVAVTIRGISRSIADAARLDGGPIRNDEIRERLAAALRELAGAIRDFGRLVRADIITGRAGAAARERVEADLLRRLGEVRQQEEALSELIRSAPATEVPGWPLGGEMLTHLSRLTDELQVEKRAKARERWPQRRARWAARIMPARLFRRRRPPGPGSGRGSAPG